MPELDAEHRDQMAEALHRTGCPYEPAGICPPCLDRADAIAPLIGEWLAAAWDQGDRAGHDCTGSEMRDGCDTANPYRGGDDD